MQTLANGVKVPDGTDKVDPTLLLGDLARSFSDALGGLGSGKRQPRTYTVSNQTEKDSLATTTALINGDQVFVEDTAWFELYDGSAWKVWMTTKAIDWPFAHTGVAVGNSLGRFSYTVMGDMITLTGSLVLGSTGQITGGPSSRLILPFPMWINGAISQVGTCQAYDLSTGAYWTGSVIGVAPNSGNIAQQAMTMFDANNATGLQYLSSTIPISWAAPDVLSLNLRYRRV